MHKLSYTVKSSRDELHHDNCGSYSRELLFYERK